MNTAPGSRRLAILLASLGAVALGVLLPGIVEWGARILHPPQPEPTLPPVSQESREVTRQLLDRFRSLGRGHYWDHVVSQADQFCGDSCTLSIRTMRAEALTRLNRDAEASAMWKTVNPNSGPTYQAPLLLLEGRMEEHEALCESLLATLDSTNPDPVSTRKVVWAALLSPKPRDPQRLLALARRVERDSGGHRRAGGSLLGAALLRAGHTEEALHTLEDVSTLPQLHALRALALRQQGRLGESLQEARLFRAQLEETFGTPSRNRVELLLFLRELDAPPIK